MKARHGRGKSRWIRDVLADPQRVVTLRLSFLPSAVRGKHVSSRRGIVGKGGRRI